MSSLLQQKRIFQRACLHLLSFPYKCKQSSPAVALVAFYFPGLIPLSDFESSAPQPIGAQRKYVGSMQTACKEAMSVSQLYVFNGIQVVHKIPTFVILTRPLDIYKPVSPSLTTLI